MEMMIANKTCCGHQHKQIWNSPEYAHVCQLERQLDDGPVPFFFLHSYHFIPFQITWDPDHTTPENLKTQLLFFYG